MRVYLRVSQLLRGSDIIGTPVRITVQKAGSHKTVVVTVVRAGAARIRAIGQLFLLMSELLSDINHGKLPSGKDVEE